MKKEQEQSKSYHEEVVGNKERLWSEEKNNVEEVVRRLEKLYIDLNRNHMFPINEYNMQQSQDKTPYEHKSL